MGGGGYREGGGSQNSVGQLWCGVSLGRGGGQSEPIAQSEPGPGHNLIGVSAVDYVSKITVLGTIAIKVYFLRKIFDGIL